VYIHTYKPHNIPMILDTPKNKKKERNFKVSSVYIHTYKPHIIPRYLTRRKIRDLKTVSRRDLKPVSKRDLKTVSSCIHFKVSVGDFF